MTLRQRQALIKMFGGEHHDAYNYKDLMWALMYNGLKKHRMKYKTYDKAERAFETTHEIIEAIWV